jgi:2-methylisocitrate lyase-like PEP mutase family enzyme
MHPAPGGPDRCARLRHAAAHHPGDDAMPSQAEKIAAFRALYEGPLFVIAHAWDAGTALMLARMGFSAIATSSGATATDLPVCANLEHGFAHDPEGVAETLRQAAGAGLAGCTIEDATGDPALPTGEMTRAFPR